MAEMLESIVGGLRPMRGATVLEVGAGTGYQSAILGRLVGPTGRVVTIELDPAIAEEARRALAAIAPNAEVRVGDGHDGWEPAAPYDAVVVTASATHVPEAWRRQLRPGGRLVVPIRFTTDEPEHQAVVVFEAGTSELRSVRIIPGGFMALRSGGGPAGAAGVGDAAPVAPAFTRGLQAVDHTSDPARVLLLSGPGLGDLSPGARTELLRTMLTRPSVRRRPMAGETLDVYLRFSLERPVRMLSSFDQSCGRRSRARPCAPSSGIGVVEAGGHGAAFPAGPPAALRVLVFGHATAARAALDRSLRAWRRASASGTPIEVVVGASAGPGRRSRGADAVSAGGCRWRLEGDRVVVQL